MDEKSERIKDLNEWMVKMIDKEEEKKIDPAWKKLRPMSDAMEHRLPGSYKG